MWLPLFIFSFIYYLIENKDDNKWNYFKIIDYSLQLVIFLLFIVRYIFFVDVKNFFRNNEDILYKNYSLVYNEDKYYINYKPNFSKNAESFPVSIFITFVSIFIFSLKVKSCCCGNYLFSNENYLFYDTNRKGRIFYLLSPFLPIYIYISIINIKNDFKIQKHYQNIKYNWNTNPISSIEVDHLKQYEIGHIFTKEKDY